MPRPWPEPLDTTKDRVEAIARALFDVVLELDAPRALRIRALAEEFGLFFLSPVPHYEAWQRITDAEAARLCGVSESTIRNWTSAGPNGEPALVTRHADGLEVGELLECKARQRRRRGHR